MAEIGARLIVDTNVWLEQLLDQDRAQEVAEFFGRVHDRELAISEFTLYSIGHILVAREQPADLRSFLTDVLIDGHVSRVRLSNHELDALPTLVEEFRLDFDDAYQYLAAPRGSSVWSASTPISTARTSTGWNRRRSVGNPFTS